MKQRILDLLGKRSHYTLALYRALAYKGSFQSFQLFMNNGLENGDWTCVDGQWRISVPKSPIVLDPLTIEVDYLLNTARQFFVPTEKIRTKLEKEGYFDSVNYTPKRATFHEMILDNLQGYQIVPGKFERNADGKIKRKTCWQSQQVFIAEFDDDVSETSLAEVLENNAFIRNNATVLIESIRSGFNDPTDDTCNGGLRYRAFFLMPRLVTNIKPAEFLIEQLKAALPGACDSGSTITNGAFGRKDTNYQIVGNTVLSSVIADWTQKWNEIQAIENRYHLSESINIQEITDVYREKIGELSFDPDGWSLKMLPCVFNTHEHDGWNSGDNAMGVFRHSDGQGYTLHCFKCSEKRTYRVKPRKRGKRRVKQISESEAVYDDLVSAEIDNKDIWDFIVAPRVFSHNRRAILVQTDAGVGKDFAMLMEAKRNDVFSLNPHSGLSEQLHSRATQRGLASYHIKSRSHGFDKIADLSLPERISVFKSDENVLCIHADRCQALLDRVGSCKEVLCNAEGCEVYEFCSQHRYISQIRKAAQCQVAHYSWPQLPTDPGSKGIVSQIMNARKKYQRGPLLWVVGEIDAQKLLNRHVITTAEIIKGIAIWQNEPAGELYRLLGELCAPHLTGKERFDKLVRHYPGLDHQAATRQLTKIGVPHLDDKYTVEFSVSKALTDGVISIENASTINEIPRMYQSHWTPIQQLERFLMHCANPDPPIFFNSTQLEFITPPNLHTQIDTYIMQSATADAGQIESLITLTADDISFDVAMGNRVEHHPEARIFKVSTGRYVRSTCFEYDKDWKVVGLKDTIRPHLENLLNILDNTPGDKFVNTYKPIYDDDIFDDDPLVSELRGLPNVNWSNWSAGYGLDLPPETALIEFGTNEPSEQVLKASCAEVYFSDANSLSFEYDFFHEHDGIRIEGIRTYKDKRVQAQYEQMTEMSQYQMANRTRPVRNPSLVLIYSSHPCKWLDGRVQWITPDMLGGNLRELKVSEPITAFQRERDEKKSLAVELAKEGLSNKEISVQLGFKSQSSVANLLKGIEL